MLLSPGNWLIHSLSVTEWLAALLLIHRYAARIQRPGLKLFAFAMLPHLVGGLLVLGFHLSGDRTGWLLDASRVLTFLGSLSLLTATLCMLRLGGRARVWPTPLMVLVLVAPTWVLALAWGLSRMLGGAGAAGLMPGTNLLYVSFLVLLVVVQRRAPIVFSPVTVAGFWFLLVFVAGAVTATTIATHWLGLPSLSHADALHGASEALLTVSNLLIVLGVALRLRALDLAEEGREAQTASGG